MLSTAIEKFSDVYEEMQDVNMLHFLEVSEHYKHGIDLAPDYQKYFLKEACGELIAIILRDNGKLIGYYIGFIGTALHYKNCLQAQMDIIFVEPNSRGQKGGLLLGEYIKAEHKRRGVQLMTMGYKVVHEPYMKQLLIDMGMHPFEVHYGLWFDDKSQNI